MTEIRRLHPLARAAGLVAAAGLLVAACSAGATPSPSAAPSVAPSPSQAASPSPAASGSPAASASPATTSGEITVAQSASLGAILVGDGGMTLYVFTNDKGGTSTCTGGCASTWPPFVVPSGTSPTAGPGVTGTLGTSARSDGSMQVTYDGSPLYYYSGDQHPGDTNGQGVGGVWFAATPSGTPATGAATGGSGGRYGAGATATPAASSGSVPTGATIAGFSFKPGTITVPVGTTITWTNADPVAHTVTADDGSFDSGNVASGATFSETFATAGTYSYHCRIHPSMTATIVVGG